MHILLLLVLLLLIRPGRGIVDPGCGIGDRGRGFIGSREAKKRFGFALINDKLKTCVEESWLTYQRLRLRLLVEQSLLAQQRSPSSLELIIYVFFLAWFDGSSWIRVIATKLPQALFPTRACA